jgi:hypothetical protein
MPQKGITGLRKSGEVTLLQFLVLPLAVQDLHAGLRLPDVGSGLKPRE